MATSCGAQKLLRAGGQDVYKLVNKGCVLKNLYSLLVTVLTCEFNWVNW